MKLPRWLMFAMLAFSVASVLAAAGWWWVTWPERTAREFVRIWNAEPDHDDELDKKLNWLLSAGIKQHFDNSPPLMSREEAARQFNLSDDEMNELASQRERYEQERRKKYPPENIQPRSRSLLDVLAARQVFEQDLDAWVTEYFTVERGKVIDMGIIIGLEDVSTVRDR